MKRRQSSVVQKVSARQIKTAAAFLSEAHPPSTIEVKVNHVSTMVNAEE
jgi:hypothetical protein